MIVIFSRYPESNLLNDGMYRRIYEIDRILSEFDRIYVYHENQGADSLIRPAYRISERVSIQSLDLGYASHFIYFKKLIEQADWVYAQTVFHSSPYLIECYSSNKIITDAHGVASAELRLSGYLESARLWEKYEEIAVNKSQAVVVVTRAMEKYYRKTFGCKNSHFIYLPICHLKERSASWDKEKNNGKYKLIYAGGTQPWQNVDLMIQSLRKCKELFNTYFLTPNTAVIEKEIEKSRIGADVHVMSASQSEVISHLKSSHFGFLLRDKDPVNEVAFPTKLIEYLAYGVIPIIKSSQIGDYETLGVEGLYLEDFINGRLPSDEEMVGIRYRNFLRYQKVLTDYQKGVNELIDFIKNSKNQNSSKTSGDILLPLAVRSNTLPIEVVLQVKTETSKLVKSFIVLDYPISIQWNFEQRQSQNSVVIFSIPKMEAELANVEITCFLEGEKTYFFDFQKNRDSRKTINLSAQPFVFEVKIPQQFDQISLSLKLSKIGKEVYIATDKKNICLNFLAVFHKMFCIYKTNGFRNLCSRILRKLFSRV